MSDSPVLVRCQGRVTVVSLDRATAHNAVDRVTAQALAEAFRTYCWP